MDQPDVQPADLAFTMSISPAEHVGSRSEALWISVVWNGLPQPACLAASAWQLSPKAKAGGADRNRTDDLMLAKHALSQLSYGPEFDLPGWLARA